MMFRPSPSAGNFEGNSYPLRGERGDDNGTEGRRLRLVTRGNDAERYLSQLMNNFHEAI